MFNRYYQDELSRLRELAVEFAHRNPAVAPLLMGPAADPDVERVLEGVAFLTGLVRQTIDDAFPDFIQDLVQLVSPQFLRPIPASTLISFCPKSPLSACADVPAGSELDSIAVDGTTCRFRTAWDLALPPLILQGARLRRTPGAAPQIEIDVQPQIADPQRWGDAPLQLFLGGGYPDAAHLLLLLARHVRGLRLEDASGQGMDLPEGALHLSGFDHALLPEPEQAFTAYRTLQEFFVQPEKFLFIAIAGLRAAAAGLHNPRGPLRLCLRLRDVPAWTPDINDNSFALGVVPALNLFSQPADPIRVDHRTSEYRVRAQGLRGSHVDIYALTSVQGTQQGAAQERRYIPFHMCALPSQESQWCYRTTLRESPDGHAPHVVLSLMYPPGRAPEPEILSIGLLCTNRSLPDGLRIGDINKATTSSPERLRFGNIRPVVPQQRAPIDSTLLWRLISQLSASFASLADLQTLRTVLTLYLFPLGCPRATYAANMRRINGIEQTQAQAETRVFGRSSVVRGQCMHLVCNPTHFAGPGDMFLFGAVLDRFFGACVSLNTYVRLEIEDSASGWTVTWPPRIGNQCLL